MPIDPSSYRVMIQMICNVFICKKGQEYIARNITRREKVEMRSYLYYAVYAVALIAFNQAVFFFFKDNNLYEQLGVARRCSAAQIKQFGDNKRKQYISSAYMDYRIRLELIRILDDKINVLIHPARRLSYDSFGFKQVEYAWAFQSPNFILQTILGSGVFFVICTFMSLINRQKTDMKEAFKIQILVLIMLFIWEVDLIVSTQSKYNSSTYDLLDSIYTAFPIFQRRQMIKAIIIPSMSLVQTYIRFYTVSTAQKKMMLVASNQWLRNMTISVAGQMIVLKRDEHLGDRVNVALEESKKKQPMRTEVYRLQRELLGKMLVVQGEQMLDRPSVGRMLHYFAFR